MHTLAILAALAAAAPPDWVGKHFDKEKDKGLFGTGVGEDATEATLDALGRFSLALGEYTAQLNKQYQAKSAEPQAEEKAAGDKRFAQHSFGKGTKVTALHKVAGDGSGSWAVKVTMTDGQRNAELKLVRGEKPDELNEAHLTVTRQGLGLTDVLLDLEAAHLFVDTFCDPGAGRCYARAALDLHRKPTERSSAASEEKPGPLPEWVLKGSGGYGGEKGRHLLAVGVAEGIRNRALREATADKHARAELRKLVDTLFAAAALHLNATLKAVDSLEDPLLPVLLRAPINDRFHQGESCFSLGQLELTELTAALVERGVPREKAGPALEKAFDAMAGR